MKAKKGNRFDNFPASIEFKRRFPETWESFSDEQKKHVVYAMAGWRAEESQLPKEAQERLDLAYEYLFGLRPMDNFTPREREEYKALCIAAGSIEKQNKVELPKEGEEVIILYEWPCEQLLGGGGAGIKDNVDGMCKHSGCKDAYLDRLSSTLSLPTEEEIEEKLEQYDQCVFTFTDGEDDEGNPYTTDDLDDAREYYAKAIHQLIYGTKPDK